MKEKTFGIITILVVTVLVFGGAFLFWLDAEKGGKEMQYANVYPEEGEIIATIEGEAYSYDPVYLFRLTSAVYAEDYREQESGLMSIAEGEPLTIDYYSTMAENAIFLELLYLEAIKNPTILLTDEDVEQRVKLRKSDFRVFEATILVGSAKKNFNAQWVDRWVQLKEESLFKPGQSNHSYFKELEPYIAKDWYIHKQFAYFLEHRPEGIDESLMDDSESRYRNFFEVLKDKYNVEMISK